MRRGSKTKTKKSDANGDLEDPSDSIKGDKEETGSTNEVESSDSSGRKRNSRGRTKPNEEDEESSKDEIHENGRSSKKRKTNKDENDEVLLKDDVNECSEELKPAKSVSKKNHKSNKGKKKAKSAPKPEENLEDGEEYEVDKIVDQRTIKGRRQFLVRWKGYSAEHDTWEQEKELNCDRLIEEFLTEQEENAEIFNRGKAIKSDGKSKLKNPDKKSNKQKKNRKSYKRDESNVSEIDDAQSEANPAHEYEVEKIIEVHFRKDKKREFLIRWKGFSAREDTWEPEENLNCLELIERFMEKLEKIRSTESRELRVNPSHTKRYTLTMYGNKRQSRRHADKQRVTYFECDV